jgi:hypothetical protein
VYTDSVTLPKRFFFPARVADRLPKNQRPSPMRTEALVNFPNLVQSRLQPGPRYWLDLAAVNSGVSRIWLCDAHRGGAVQTVSNVTRSNQLYVNAAPFPCQDYLKY